jgi:phage pi2 protein 07
MLQHHGSKLILRSLVLWYGNHWLLDEEKAKIVKTKQVATMKKNKRLGKTYLTNSLVDDPERNRRFRETLQLAHKNPTTRKRHSVASKKNWESEEYRAKIPKRKRGFKPMYKNGKYIQVYQDKLQQHLDDGWIIKGRYITSEEQKEKRIESLKSTLNSPEYKKKLSERQKAWFAIPEKKQNMLMLRNKTNSFYQMIYTEHLTDESKLLTNYLFCQEMIRLCKTHKIKKFSVTKRTITSGSVFGKIILTYSKLEVATIHQNINCMIQYAKTIVDYDKTNKVFDVPFSKLEEQLFSFIDKDLKLPKHLKLSSYL